MFERINARLRISATARRRVAAVTAAACAAAAGAVAGGSASAAPPVRPPSFAATLSHDSACLLIVNATWQNASVDHVYGMWYYDGPYRITTEAPGIGATFRRGSSLATMTVGPTDQAGEFHTWQVRVQFYDRRGAQLAEVMTSVDSAQCKIPPLPPA